MRFFKLIILLFLICLFCNFQSGPNQISTVFRKTQTDTAIYSILNFKRSQTWLFKNARPSTLSLKEVDEVELILNKWVQEYNPAQKSQFDSVNKLHPGININIKHFIIILSRYKRQYVPVINRRGEKEVWVNCFCGTDNKNWRTEIVSVRDGGNCYFHLKINLSTKMFYEVLVNGVG